MYSNKKTQPAKYPQMKSKNDPLLDFICLGPSKQAMHLRSEIDFAKKIAGSTVLLVGETGCGKEALAKHLWQERKQSLNLSDSLAPFIAVNMGAIPEELAESLLFGHLRGAFTSARDRQMGKFEQAKEGVLFLDEIQNMSLGLQAKLLRAIQEKEIDPLGGQKSVRLKCQIIAASNASLEGMVNQRKFRSDLYYRLMLNPVYLTPLRERKEDLRAYIDHFIDRISRLRKLEKSPIPSEGFINELQKHCFPGNLRELENSLHYTIMRSDNTLECDHIAPWIKHFGKEKL